MKNDEEKNRKANPAPYAKADDPDSLSRREWFLQVGGAALAAGLPSLTGEAAASVLQGENSHLVEELPPGLYLPSGECLGRALESDGLFHAIPPGSETDYARPIVGMFKPSFFSEDEFRALRRLVEFILGLQKDSTVSAEDEQKAEAVSRWIDLRVASAAGVREAARALSPEHRAVAIAYYGAGAVHRLETEAPEPICQEGFAWIERESQQKYGARFTELNEARQIDILNEMSDDRPEKDGENAGMRFFKFLKAEAIHGYYTSQAGLKELDDQGNRFHAESPSCNL